MSDLSEQMRREWGHNDAERDKNLKTPDDIIRFDNISYGPDTRWNLLDVYRPKKVENNKLPVIVIIHGGGWVYGTKEIYQFYGMHLAQHGFAVINYNYRLAPEVKYPASFEDSAAVIRWIYEHHAKYGLDVKNLILAGDSAGGNMAGVIVGIMTNKEYAALYPTVHFPSEFSPIALLMNCGAYQLFKKDGSPDRDTMEPLIHDYLDENHFDEYKMRLNVIDLVNDKFPPAYIMTAQGDFLKRQAQLLAKACCQHKIEFVYRMFGTKADPLFHVFHVTIYNPSAIRCNNEECSFVKEYIKA